MRVVELQDAFGLDHLVGTERPDPEPAAGELLLQMRAASINFRDLLTIQGAYNPKQPLPLIPCSDGVGEVIEVGPGVSRIEVGQRVIPLFTQAWFSGEPSLDELRATLGGPLDGTLCERMVVPEEAVVVAPEHLSDDEAATLPCAALTAWSALVTEGGVKAGDTVLVLGTGGVAIFALQFAVAHGAEVIVTSSSDAKLERVLELGARAGINYRTQPEWGREVARLTAGRGVDWVVEVGGAATLPQSLRAVRPGGQISLIGNLTGGVLELNLIPILMRHVRIQGILVGHRQGFEAMNRCLATHRLHPVIDRTFAFEDVHQAFEHMAERRHLGKICLRI